MATAKIIPPPNDQKDDPTWKWEGIQIKGTSQCQGNSNEDCIKAIAEEFGKKELQQINTFTYYSMFFGILKSQKHIAPQRNNLMDYRNHAWFMNTLFKAAKIPIIAIPEEIQNDPRILHRAIEVTQRPISVGTLLSSSGHWIRIHKSSDITKVFFCNDPYGSHPYQKDQKGGFCEYSWDYLKQHTIRRMITFQDLKETK